MDVKSIVWIAPNLNHYKIRFLNHFSEKTRYNVVVITGEKNDDNVITNNDEEFFFQTIYTKANKNNFNYKISVFYNILKSINKKKTDFVLLPCEKKFYLLLLFLFCLKQIFKFKLISYNHPIAKNKATKNPVFQIKTTKLFYLLYDRIIFYTNNSKEWAIKQNLIAAKKAYYANNTLDTEMIWNNYDFHITKTTAKKILFIGRLIPSKRIDLFIDYYKEIKKNIPNLETIIIGHGPDNYLVREAINEDPNIVWKGAITNEYKIAQEMIKSNIVFIPGLSGLSIVHAFCYGKPYITIKNENHGPEIDYLLHGENGFILSGNKKKRYKIDNQSITRQQKI